MNALEKPSEEKWIKAMAGVTHSEIGFMTDHITTLANFHTIFLAEFDKDLEHAPSVFLSYAAYFKMYSSYMNSFDIRLATLNRLRATNKKFAVYVKHIEESLRIGGSDLASYLIMPVQRIPRYVLLLKEITKHTPPDHPEYRNHLMALEKVKAIAAHINSAKADAEALAKLMQVQYKITNCNFELVQPHRQIVREGILQVVSTSKRLLSSSKPKPRYVFLFNDLLLWINETSNTMKGKIMLTSSTSATQLENFDLEIASNNEVFVARITEPLERKQWLDSFQDVIRQQKFIYANKRTALNRRATTTATANSTVRDSVPRRSSHSGSEAPSAEVSLVSVTDLSVADVSREGDIETTKPYQRVKRNSLSSALPMDSGYESDSDAADPLMIRTGDHQRTESSDLVRMSPTKPARAERNNSSSSFSSSVSSSSLSSASASSKRLSVPPPPSRSAPSVPSSNITTLAGLNSIVSSHSVDSFVTPRNGSKSLDFGPNDAKGSPLRNGCSGCARSPGQASVNITRTRAETSSFRAPIISRPTSLTIPDSPGFKPAPLRAPPPRSPDLAGPPSPDLPPPPSDFPLDFIPPPPLKGPDSESDNEPLPPPAFPPSPPAVLRLHGSPKLVS